MSEFGAEILIDKECKVAIYHTRIVPAETQCETLRRFRKEVMKVIEGLEPA
jgi:hypothetical protein